MEKLFYNLSEEEFSKGRKIVIWSFAGLFFLAGIFVLIKSLVLGHKSIPPILSLAPFGISLVVSIIAYFATVKRDDLFFSVDDDKIEFRYGVIKPKRHTVRWNEISGLIMPRKQKKVKLLFTSGSSLIINLTWLQRKKSSLIRKHIYYAAREKNLEVNRVNTLKEK